VTGAPLVLALVLAVCAAMPATHAEPFRAGEKIEFEAPGVGGGTQRIFGQLVLPEGRHGAVPAMVVVPGSPGVTDAREGHYVRAFVRAGIAAFVIDSLTPRGVLATPDDQGRLSDAQVLADAYAALELLAARREIDRRRIGILGAGKGGNVALLAMDRHGAGSGPHASSKSFAVSVALYPSCAVQYRNPRPAVPLLLLLAGADDYTGVEPCRRYAARLRDAGGSVELIVYPGAPHGFDGDERFRGLQAFRRAQNVSSCLVHIEDDGRFTLAPTGVPLENARQYLDVLSRNCMTRGASIGTDPVAKRKSLGDILSFVARRLLD